MKHGQNIQKFKIQ